MWLMLEIIIIVLLLLFGFLFFKFRKNRREMLLGGMLSIPLVLSWTMVNYDGSVGTVALTNILLRLVLGFLLAGVAAALYEVYFLDRFKIAPHPHRAKLAQLILGPILFLVLVLSFHVSGVLSILVGFLIEVLILAYHRKELLWEAIVSGLFIGLVSVVVFVIISRTAPMGFSLLPSFSGIDIFGLPIEAILFVFGYGMLWGPLYEGVKKGRA